ncbi:MAG: response regulator transcription factor [Synechococcus sp. MED-G135]|nr:MAG: response regulator transcription factor [Synechococcus sp. MED-G135]
MDFTSQIPLLQERRRQGHGLLRRSRTLIGSRDRVLLASLVGWMEGVSPLVGAATTETELLLHVRQHHPDLLICTDGLEQGSGVSLLRQARHEHPAIKTLLLVQRPLVRTILDAIDSGCDGICAAELTGNGSVHAALNAMESDNQYIDRVAAGVLSHGRLRRSASGAPLGSATEQATATGLAALSLREEDVLHGLCKGMTNQDIADALTVSIDTVKSHVSSVLRKLDVNDRTQAVVMAFQTGLVDLPSSPPAWTN